MLGKLLSGATKPLVEGVRDVAVERENTKQAQAKGLAEAMVASASWRPWLAKSTCWMMIIYGVGSLVIMMLIFFGIRADDKWVSGITLRELLDFWRDFGVEIFAFASLFLTTYTASRGFEKYSEKRPQSGFIGKTIGSVAGLVTGNNPEVIREPMIAGEAIQKIDGVEYQRKPVTYMTPASAQKVRAEKNYFNAAELECKGQNCNCVMPEFSPTTMAIANDLRERFGALIVNSGFRCAVHNKNVGGAQATSVSKGSYHLQSRAIDLRSAKVSPEDMYNYLVEKYPNKYGFGLYQNFIHLDDRGNGYFARKSGANKNWRKYKLPDMLV